MSFPNTTANASNTVELTSYDCFNRQLLRYIIYRSSHNNKKLLWKCEEESASFAGFGLHPGFVAVYFREFAHDRKSNACTLNSVAGSQHLEHLENLFIVFFVYSRSIISDAESPKVVLLGVLDRRIVVSVAACHRGN
jgi:hypothetical protein